MGVDVTKLIAAINPDLFCDPSVRGEVKRIVAEGLANKDTQVYLNAAKVAKLKESQGMIFEDIAYTGGAYHHPVTSNPIERHQLVLDTFNGSLEPIYFWILDYVNGYFNNPAIKLVDNFLSSTGSGHFAEMQGRATRMQEEAMKMLGAANQVIKSILNIIYDLKEFKMRLGVYDDYKSSDKNTKEAARLSLKQIWLDQVDIKRGNSSIKALAVSGANQPNFVTLIDAFMVVDSLDQLKKKPEDGGLDLNERVKRILEQRVPEFERWIKESEAELRKRFEIEKSYLKSQVSTVKLYSHWIKPYLKAARDLEQNASATAGLVTAFNTLLLELVLMASAPYSPADAINKGEFPEFFKKDKIKSQLGKFYAINIIEFRFRSIPERAAQQQGYAVRGRLESVFTSFALSDVEYKLLQKEIEKDNMGELFKVIENTTDESLSQINADIEYFLEGKEQKKEAKPKDEDTNPFAALFSFGSDSKEDKKKDDKKPDFFAGIPPDTEWQKGIRNMALFEARVRCRKVYDIYKKAHGLPNFPAPGG